MRVVDAFCGVGGVSAGCLQLEGVDVILGVDSDDRILRLWAQNTQGRAVCACVGKDEIPWPEEADDLHVHFSPPCTALSKARLNAPTKEVEDGLGLLKHCLDLVVSKGYRNFSIENVSTNATRAIAEAYTNAHPARVAYSTVECADFGVPQTRSRLVISSPYVIQRIRETAVCRVSVAEAFRDAGVTPAATHLKNCTSDRKGSRCLRSVEAQAFTVTASHPLTWATVHGETVRCLTVTETAILQGLPASWTLSTLGSRRGIRAVGNAVPSRLAEVILRYSIQQTRLTGDDHTGTEVALKTRSSSQDSQTKKRKGSSHSQSRYGVSHKHFRALKRRVRALEKLLEQRHSA